MYVRNSRIPWSSQASTSSTKPVGSDLIVLLTTPQLYPEVEPGKTGLPCSRPADTGPTPSGMRAPLHPLATPARRFLAVGLAALAVTVAIPRGAVAAPEPPVFGPVIEDYALYQGQRFCRPRPKPGVVAFQGLLQQAYPDSTWFNISRPCTDRGQSEHKEGRALDWSRNAAVAAERATVRDLFAWLFAADGNGNTHAMARRLGIMYIVWNRRIWKAWEGGWETYCVQRGRRCKDPDSRAVLHPHTDHVHFSFGWPGARMLTTFWNPALSQVAPEA
jgi:hypothetical protein